MASSQTMAHPHDRVHFYVATEVAVALERIACDKGVAVDELVDSLFANDAEFRVPPPKEVKGTRCPCCDPHNCQHQWIWRNQRRCGCTPERIAFHENGQRLR